MKRRHVLGAVAAVATGTGVAAVLGKDPKAAKAKTAEKVIGAPNIFKRPETVSHGDNMAQRFSGPRTNAEPLFQSPI